ncbi:MAG: HAD hydrolase-like protein [Chloroflexi bacterium]|nr:HAD hydrolase-like protein [Chloroflexota bacterium]
MIKVALVDLDDTLIRTNTDEFIAAYLKTWAIHASHKGWDGRTFVEASQVVLKHIFEEYDPSRTIAQRFLDGFARTVQEDIETIEHFFHDFFETSFRDLQPRIEVLPAAQHMIRALQDQGVRIVVATNPALPRASIIQRMAWGGWDDPQAFEQITTMETMAFAKPQPEYYAELLIQLDVDPGQAIMIGDSWTNDIVPAAAVGIRTVWLNGDMTPQLQSTLSPAFVGSHDEFTAAIKDGWLKTCTPRQLDRTALLARLAAYPSIVARLCADYPQAVLECIPAEGEWSVRDVICHLVDHEREEDRAKLERVLTEDNPFLSANYDPWDQAYQFAAVPVDEAYKQFVHYRHSTLQWLDALPHEIWTRPARHPIFGPTSFLEMVKFITDHDRTHLQQMRHTVRIADQLCELEQT